MLDQMGDDMDMRGLVAAALAAMLAGCSPASLIPASSPMPAGALTAAPAGWVDYCQRNQEDPACPLN